MDVILVDGLEIVNDEAGAWYEHELCIVFLLALFHRFCIIFGAKTLRLYYQISVE